MRLWFESIITLQVPSLLLFHPVVHSAGSREAVLRAGSERWKSRERSVLYVLSLSLRRTAVVSRKKLGFFFPIGLFCLWWTTVWFWLELQCRMQFMSQNPVRSGGKGCFGQSPPSFSLNSKVPYGCDPCDPVVRASGEKPCFLTSKPTFCIILRLAASEVSVFFQLQHCFHSLTSCCNRNVIFFYLFFLTLVTAQHFIGYT